MTKVEEKIQSMGINAREPIPARLLTMLPAWQAGWRGEGKHSDWTARIVIDGPDGAKTHLSLIRPLRRDIPSETRITSYLGVEGRINKPILYTGVFTLSTFLKILNVEGRVIATLYPNNLANNKNISR